MWTTCKWNAQTKTTNLLCIAVHGFDKRLQKYILLFCECMQSAVEVQTKLTAQRSRGLEFIVFGPAQVTTFLTTPTLP